MAVAADVVVPVAAVVRAAATRSRRLAVSRSHPARADAGTKRATGYRRPGVAKHARRSNQRMPGSPLAFF